MIMGSWFHLEQMLPRHHYIMQMGANFICNPIPQGKDYLLMPAKTEGKSTLVFSWLWFT